MNSPDVGFDTLPDLDGSILEQDGGDWVMIEVRRIPPSVRVQDGIRYSLSLHDKYGTRVMGYDKAHAVKPPKKFKFAGQRLPYDHRHRTSSDKCAPYAFESAQRLLEATFLVGPHLTSGAFVEALPPFRSIELGVFAVYPSRRHLTWKVRVLIDFPIDAFRMRAWPLLGAVVPPGGTTERKVTRGGRGCSETRRSKPDQSSESLPCRGCGQTSAEIG
jgi:hypothetical protein